MAERRRSSNLYDPMEDEQEWSSTARANGTDGGIVNLGYMNKDIDAHERQIKPDSVSTVAEAHGDSFGKSGSAVAHAPAKTDRDMRCGLGSCKPDCLQLLNNPKVICLWLSWFAFIQGFVVNGINNVSTTSLERRFELKSAEVSLVSSSYDISAGILVLPITYFGAFAHQPRMLSVAALVMACGSFIMALPHFTTDLYELKDTVSDQCLVHDNTTLSAQCAYSSHLSSYLGVFILGMILHGVGGTTIYSIGIVFLDSSVRTEDSPLYQGILYGCSALGPAVGYLLGGQFVDSIYVDFDKVGTEGIGVTSDDVRWVGAWWIGFLASGSLAVTVFLVLLPYPRELPSAAMVKAERVSQVHANGSEDIANREGFGTTLRDLPMSLKLLLKNPVYMMLNLSGVSEGIATSGVATFIPKLIQNQFAQSSGFAAILAGAIAVPGAAGGQLVGGLICKGGNLKVRGMLRVAICACVGATVLTIVNLSRCAAVPMAGVAVPYPGSDSPIVEPDVVGGCNAVCNCTTVSYEPICGHNDIQYFSPCHAGCETTKENGTKVFKNCLCIPHDLDYGGSLATEGACHLDCSQLQIYLPLFFLVIFLTFVSAVPTVSVTLRCVPERQRAFALGLQWVFVRFLGTVPGPIIFGAIFDSTCVVWQEKCDEQGSCWVYDNETLSIRSLLLMLCVKCISSVFFILAYVAYKPPKDAGAMEPENAGVNGLTTGPNGNELGYAMNDMGDNRGSQQGVVNPAADFPNNVDRPHA